MPKPKKPRTPDDQHAAFIAAARELGCSESEADFLETMKTLAAAKPTTNAEVKRRAKQGRKKK